MKTPIKLKPTKNTVAKFILYPAIAWNLFVLCTHFFGGGGFEELISNIGYLLILASPILLSSLFAIVILLTSKVEIHDEGIYQKGYKKYGFRELIPWGNILKVSIYSFKGGHFLKLHIKYNRNALSKNGSKAIDNTNILLSIKLSPYSDSEILEFVKLARQNRC